MKAFYFYCLLSSISLLSCKKSGSRSENPDSVVCTNVTKVSAENIAVFPANNPWNISIETAPKDSRSDAIISLIATDNPSVKADFGSGIWNNAPIGIPYEVVCGSQLKVTVVYRANS